MSLTPVFRPTRPGQKILYSPGHDAGWATCVSQLSTNPWPCIKNDDFVAGMLTYQPLIDYVEDDERTEQSVRRRPPHERSDGARCRRHQVDPTRPGKEEIMRQFVREAREGFGLDVEYINRGRSLRVAVVDGPFMLLEYDRDESVIMLKDQKTIVLK